VCSSVLFDIFDANENEMICMVLNCQSGDRDSLSIPL
jgi:hypothetical protein